MPGERYAARGVRTTDETTLGTLWGETDGATPTRLWIYDMVLGIYSTYVGTDEGIQFNVSFATGGTPAGTAVTPAALSQDDGAAATSDWLETLTTNPTTIASEPLLSIGLNQRATFRWVAPPGGELVVAAAAGNGILWHQAGNDVAVSKAITAHFIE